MYIDLIVVFTMLIYMSIDLIFVYIMLIYMSIDLISVFTILSKKFIDTMQSNKRNNQNSKDKRQDYNMK